MTNEQLAERLNMIAHMIEWDYPLDYFCYLIEAANRLKRPHDKWIELDGAGAQCPICRKRARRLDMLNHHFCGYCGAQLEVPDAYRK